jgi:hypothetical protein
MEETRIGYMCQTDFEHELGKAVRGNLVYPSVAALKQSRNCVDECGIVEVEIRLRQVVQEGTI